MSADSSLGREIRRLRAASGLTPAELSARSGVPEANLTAIEDDREEPSAAALRRIVRPLEPAGASYAQLAAFLTAPELDVR
jgi:transcriptional regulator with XRE-family HTH domain